MATEDDQKLDEVVIGILDQGRRDGPSTLDENQLIVFLVVELDTYICMEGLWGFYASPLGIRALETENALRRIGAMLSADLLHQSNSAFPDDQPPTEEPERHRVLNSLDDATFERIQEIG